MKDLRVEAETWCRGRSGLVRLPLLLGFGYMLIRSFMDPAYSNLLWPLNLAFHEAGHLLFGYGGKFLGILGGTLLECLMPVFAMLHLYRQRDFFAIALCFGWLSTVLLSVARYAGDARQMALPLVSVSWGPEIVHDWNYLLSRAGLLSFDGAVAFLFRAFAGASMLVCLTAGVWLVWCMMTNREIG